MSELKEMKARSMPLGFSVVKQGQQGQPGKEGPTGPQGPAGSGYIIKCNIESIVRGLINPISPSKILFTAYKTSETNEEQLTFNGEYSLKLYDGIVSSTGEVEFKEIELKEGYFEFNNSKEASLNLNGLSISSTETDLITIEGGYAKDQDKDNVFSIKASLYKDGILLSSKAIPFTFDTYLMELTQAEKDEEGNIKVTIGSNKVTAESIVTGSIISEKIATGAIETDHFQGNQIKSSNFESGEANTFSKTGTLLELKEGSIHTPNFYVGTDGTVDFKNGNISGKLTVGNKDTVTIDGSDSNTFISAGNVFNLSKEGKLFTQSAEIAGWEVDSTYIKKDQVGLFSGSDIVRGPEGAQSPVRIFAGEGDLNNKPFTVTSNGYLYASNADIKGKINATSGNISGTLLVGQDNSGIIINGTEGSVPSISSSKYASGATGWTINNNGYAEFADAYIRGTLRSAVFEVGTVNAVGGDLYVAPTINIKKDDLKEIERDSEEKIILTISNTTVLKDAIGSDIIANQWHDARVLLDFNGKNDEEEEVNYNQIQGNLFFEKDDSDKYKKECFYIKFNSNEANNLQEVTSNITVIKLGQGKDNHYIRLTANTSQGDYTPYIDVYSAPSTESDSLPKVRLGNLNGINDTENFGSLSGYGLYSNNAYLTGAVYLPNAGISNQEEYYYKEPESSNSDDKAKYALINNSDDISEEEKKKQTNNLIRFWAGGKAPVEGNEVAPFIVTQDGSLYASRGIFSGIVKAKNSEFSGIIRAAGIVIDDSDTSELESQHNHFFVGYKEVPSSNSDYVIDIDSRGLRIWEGGFNVYSDTLNDSLYGYQQSNPYPYVSAIDAGRLAVRDINIMSPTANNSFSSIYSSNGALYFGNIKTNVTAKEDFSTIESNLFNGAKSSIQIEKEEETNGSFFVLKTSQAAMRINETASSIEAKSENFIVSNPEAAAKLSFNAEISIEEVRQQAKDSNGNPMKDSNGNPIMETIGFNFLI